MAILNLSKTSFKEFNNNNNNNNNNNGLKISTSMVGLFALCKCKIRKLKKKYINLNYELVKS